MAKIDDSVKKKVPELRFKGFTDDWEQRKLSNESTITAGGDIDKAKLKEVGEYPIFANALTNDGTVGYYDSYYRVEAPAVTVTGRGDVGHAKARKVNFTPVVRLLAVKSNHDVDFLENAINNHKVLVESTGVPQLTAPQLGNYKIFFPTGEEQQKIGSFFKQLDDTIDLHQRKLDLLKEQKKGYLQKMFPKNGKKVPELRFAGFADDWEQRKLKDIFDVHTDFVSNGSFQALKENVQLYKTENYAYMIRLQDASNNWDGPWLYTDKQGFDFLDKSTVYKDDILMSDRGTIGKFFLVPQLDKPMTLSSNAVLLRSTKNDNNFIYYMLNTSNISNQIIVRTTPGVQPMISKTEFKKINTCIPNIEEQQKIGSFFQQLDETIALHQRKLDLLKEQKKGYLQKMFV
ncbi:restriction endonuclease subunit S [Lactococcus lactis]|uniref:restriction endonuclease subunit S n=1 Tax=Lactococcus lactis TaxID=1358 RepID=UPI0021AE3841|nr:restriction endonuclease subunit S [Lactococcus lactis]